MSAELLQSIDMAKYQRLLLRLFPGAVGFAMQDRVGELIWTSAAESPPATEASEETREAAQWSEIASGIQKRSLTTGELQFRSPLRSREAGALGWFVVEFSAHDSVPIVASSSALARAFVDLIAFLQGEIEMQSECNQLARELSERYEELNLVYATKDQVEYFEEGQEALSLLVHNCTDYLAVDFSALICRERGLVYSSASRGIGSATNKDYLDVLQSDIYEYVESQIKGIIIHGVDDPNRQELFRNLNENLLAHPVVDDHNVVIGLIAVIVRDKQREFSNGDRNLLEVMAKKATRIINTHHDSLTGLMNRRGFEPSLVAALTAAQGHNQEHCLLHINLDQLHVVNDLLGHQEGDALIRRAANLLREAIRERDTLARLGGDEFAILLPNCPAQHGLAVGEKIRDAVHDLHVISANRRIDVTCSIGVATLDVTTESIVGVMAAAEIACKSAKEAGRDRVQIFAAENSTLVRRSEEIEWIGRLQEALREGSFVLYCQPVLSAIDRGKEPHFEILVRMQDENGEILSPGAFMPAAERYQLMPQIDRWIIERTLHDLDKVWANISASGAVFCINLSGQSLTQPGFQKFVYDEIGQSAIPAENLCFEITETAAIANIDEALQFIDATKKLGCKFSLDDFGAGLSSFGYLKMLPVDYLKIDGSFISEITTDRLSLSMVESICKIGQTMGLSTVAEYVGDAASVTLLTDMGVDYLQGFFIGKPEPLECIVERLQCEQVAATS